MKDPQILKSVKLFHETFDHPVLEEPAIPAKDRCELRVSLITEELKELKDAIADNDLVEVADALCDLQYVLVGTILEFGLGNRFKALFEEVQRSNMSKACKNPQESLETKFHYISQGVQVTSIKKDGVYIIQRDSDGKTMKSINYSPACLKPIIDGDG